MLLVGRIVTELMGLVITGKEMRPVHFMLVIAFDSFQMSTTKLKVAPDWMEVDILKQFAENLVIFIFENRRCVVAAIFVEKRISDEDGCMQMPLQSKRRQIIIFNSPNSQQKTSMP